MSNDLERNKQNAQAFYDLMFNQCRPREAIETYAGDVYIQHNPEVGDGKEAFVAYFEKMALVGGVLGILLLLVIYVLGRRAGKKQSSVLEIRRL